MAKNINISDVQEELLKQLAENDLNFQVSTYLRQFQNLPTNISRVNKTYDQLQQYNLLPELKKDAKNDAAAKGHWKEANKLLCSGEYMEALEYYTVGIVKAKSKEVLAISYANRSACLYKMQLYRECIADINRALSKYCPEELKPKLLERRNRAEKHGITPERFYQDIPKIPSGRKNPTIQCARNCVEIRKNALWGRHVVATRDIQIGEVICVEKAYAAWVQEATLIHCHHCMELCYNPIPCPECSLAVYCSEVCKNKAKKSYHKYLCPIRFTCVECGMKPIDMLSLKTAILARDEFDTVEELRDDEEQYRSDRYKELHYLMAATKERPAKDLLEKTIMTVFIYHLLRNETNFFSENRISEESFKEVLLLQMQVVNLNHLAIYESIQSKTVNDCVMFGIGIFSFASLINHSCCPNVDSVQYGQTNVLRAINTIPKGKQLFITYSLQYDAFPLDFRKKHLLESFYFDCKCEACEHNWMMVEETHLLNPTLCEDLEMSETEIYAINVELGQGNNEMSRKFLKILIPHFKRIEHKEPYGNTWKMKDLIEMCYKTLGNKRRI